MFGKELEKSNVYNSALSFGLGFGWKRVFSKNRIILDFAFRVGRVFYNEIEGIIEKEKIKSFYGEDVDAIKLVKMAVGYRF